MDVARSISVLAGALLLACARPPAPAEVGDDAALAIARLEARREAGSAELIARSEGPPTWASLRAIGGLGRVGDRRSLARLVALLDSSEPELRAAAARAIDVAGALGAEVTQLEALPWRRWAGASVGERVAIVESMRRVGGAATVPRLGEALGPGEAPEVREAAAIVLGILGRRGVALTPEARAGLVALAGEGEPRLQYAAIYGLAHEHAPEPKAGEAALVEATRANDPDTRALAIKGLARRKTAAGLAAARAGLGDADPWVQVAAVRGLGELGEPAAIAAVWDWLAARLNDEMSDGTAAHHPVLEAISLLVGREDGVAGAAEAHAQAERRLQAAAPAARRVQARIACGLASLAARRPDWRPPLDCAGAAGEAASERAQLEAELLAQGWGGPVEARLGRLQALAKDADPRVRAAALTAASRMWREAPEVVAGMIAAGLQDSSPAVAGAAAEAVQGRLGGERPEPDAAVVAALLDRAGHERDPELFATLAGAVAAVGGARGLQICGDALADANAAVRLAARACVTTATGRDPGATGATKPAPIPPHDPSTVLGRSLLWRLDTERGRVEVALDPAAAPWHVAAIVALTQAGFYDGLTFHRVVPGYVVQGGDPTATGWGGPGFNLPSEPGDRPFARGAVGIADAGKDTGGSQFFIMHARAPHLGGRYTWVGEVRDGLDAALALVVGDRILAAEIVIAPQSHVR